MGVFHVFKIVQMLPNRATHHILEAKFGDNTLAMSKLKKVLKFWNM